MGNIHEENTLHKNIELVELEWEELNKRILRKKTNKGREIAISLETGNSLQEGDILYQDEEVQIVVQTKKEEVYVIYPRNMTEMGKISFELGNRHTPSLIKEDEIVVRYDYTLEKLFDEVGVKYEKTTRRFDKAFKYRGHQH